MTYKAFLFFILIFLQPAYAEKPVSEEYVKAAYLFHFLNFTQWDDALNNYYVCIPQDPELKDAAEEMLDGKTVGGRKIVVLENYRSCHIQVSDNPSSSMTVLTIGPLHKGSLMEFKVVNNKLKFMVNVERVQKSKVKISSQVLKLAIVQK